MEFDTEFEAAGHQLTQVGRCRLCGIMWAGATAAYPQCTFRAERFYFEHGVSLFTPIIEVFVQVKTYAEHITLNFVIDEAKKPDMTSVALVGNKIRIIEPIIEPLMSQLPYENLRAKIKDMMGIPKELLAMAPKQRAVSAIEYLVDHYTSLNTCLCGAQKTDCDGHAPHTKLDWLVGNAVKAIKRSEDADK